MSKEEKEELLKLEKWIRRMGLLKEANLIDKLQKENEELTNKLSKIQCDNRQLELELEKANKQMDLDYVDNNFISKDIIRDKIKEVAEEPQIYVDTEKFDIAFEKSNFTIKVLKKLLGE